MTFCLLLVAPLTAFAQGIHPHAISQKEANFEDMGMELKAVGDALFSFPAPAPIIKPWGICHDGENLHISDPLQTPPVESIFEVTPAGAYTGNVISISLGQNFIGDMASDGTHIYACLVGGPNTIAKVHIASGDLVGTISGDWTITSQRGLAYDAINEEFYIGGWNSNNIWRVSNTGVTISEHAFTNVSGLTWHPNGGPLQQGSLWVMTNAASSTITEVDPNNGWAVLQSFPIPGSPNFSGAGMDLDPSGNLWVVNQADNMVYLVDTEQPLGHAAVPLGQWSLYLVVIMSAGFLFFRFRRAF